MCVREMRRQDALLIYLTAGIDIRCKMDNSDRDEPPKMVFVNPTDSPETKFHG